MSPRHFGPVPGVLEGQHFVNRRELFDGGVHRQLQAGISGTAADGAESIVLSGGYEDDAEIGGVILYTGQGGRDTHTGLQVAHQTLTRGNLALARSRATGLPVRVIRGADHDSPLSPAEGYQYGGLYRVDDSWHEVGRSGFRIYRYRLVRLSDLPAAEHTPPEPQPGPDDDAPAGPAPRRTVTMQRIVRDTAAARQVKEWHRFTCQVCGVPLVTPAGPYAEAAHIRPLGAPHDGPDETSNLLCLCPNHHVLFDLGAFTVNADLTFTGLPGTLRCDPRHAINAAHLAYHAARYAPGEADPADAALPAP